MFAESTRETVEYWPHHVIEKGALTGLDVEISRHAGSGTEIFDLGACIPLIDLHAHDESVAP